MRSLVCACMAVALTATVWGQAANAWIDYGKTYYKLQVSEDGIYRIPQDVLVQAGLGDVAGSAFRLYHMGEEVPLYTTSDGALPAEGFIEFYGEKNRGELDRELYEDPAHQLNPGYSMFTDISTYYLTWAGDGAGKRITALENDISNPPAAEPYYLHREEMIYSEEHFKPRIQSSVAYSHFVNGEGFVSRDQKAHTVNLQSSEVAPGVPDSATLEIRFVTSNLVSHDISILIQGDTIYSEQIFYVGMRTIHHKIPASEVDANMELQIKDDSESGRIRLAYVHWTYPRNFTMPIAPTAKFAYPGSASTQYFEAGGFDHDGENPVVYDLEADTRTIADVSTGQVRFVLPAGSDRQIYISAAGAIQDITALEEYQYTDWAGDDTEFILISHPRFRTGGDAVGAYLDYRQSEAGGGYNARYYNILDIHEQFGYGVARHPQALRNFNQFIAQHWENAQMVFIVGKSIEYNSARTWSCDNDCEQWFSVPTFGTPGADNLLFTLPGERLVSLPVGRIPVINQEEIDIYLSKVKEHDQVPFLPQTVGDKAWTKNILHLGGGADSEQQENIEDHLNEMGNILSASSLGAEVMTFTKATTNATGSSNSDKIIELFQEGVSIAKFFGHSSANTLDFQINNPADWNNKGKYPVFSAMGCKAGAIHEDFRSLSEHFIFEPDAGSIAFVAGSGNQFLNPLAAWGKEWYRDLSADVGGMTLGKSIRQSLVQMSSSPSYTERLLVEQQTLAGDPALQFYPPAGADYIWDNRNVRFEPSILTTALDTYDLTVDLLNLGLNIIDSADVLIEQELPDGSIEIVYDGRVQTPKFRNTLTLTLPVLKGSRGPNRLYLTVDPYSTVEELPDPVAEENNVFVSDNGKTGISMFILDNRVLTTYPAEFSIITESQPELIASGTNAFVKGRPVVVELDTTTAFNSPLLERNVFPQARAVVKWKPTSALIPNTVYYWRVSIDSTGTSGYYWDESSFLYQPGGQRGWNQSHYFQFLKDDFQDLKLNENTRAFQFTDRLRNIWVQNAVRRHGDPETAHFFINNGSWPQFFRHWNNRDGNVFVVVIDSLTADFMLNPPGGIHGALNPYGNALFVFPFRTDNAEDRDALMTFLEEIIPSGQYVILYTYQRFDRMDYFPEQWAADSLLYGRNIFSVIEEQYPESDIRSLQESGSVPYTLYYRKDKGVIQEQIALNIDATINVDNNFSIRRTEGRLYSRLVGPASHWDRIEWGRSGMDDVQSDSISLRFIALSQDLADTLSSDFTTEPVISLGNVDPEMYPFIQLELFSSDPSEMRSSPQLEHWTVYYEGMPEVVFNPDISYHFERDSMQLGDYVRVTTVIENISPYDVDSLEILYQIVDPKNDVSEDLQSLAAIPAGDMREVSFEKRMVSMAGEHQLLVELNPSGGNEQYHFNNFGIRNFLVLEDRRKPLMDVTFDGRHLNDADIVARSPLIRVSVTDDNPFFPVDSPDDIQLAIKYPGQFDFTEIPSDDPDISFFPAGVGEAPENAALLELSPEFESKGFYTFRATARDASGNLSGEVAYEVRFEVLGEPFISQIEVAPNPFIYGTQFGFLLSGDRPPAEFAIEIISPGGIVVRRLTWEDLGPEYVGTHRFWWDGSDQAGNPLPAGLYFYQFIVRDENGLDYSTPNNTGMETGRLFIVR